MTQAKPSGCAFTDYAQPQMINVADMGEHELLNWRIGKVKDNLVALDFAVSGDTVFRFQKCDVIIDVDFGLYDICVYMTFNGDLKRSEFFSYKREHHSWDTDLIKYVEEKINEHSR